MRGFVMCTALFATVSGVPAATKTWDGGGANDNWSTGANWNGAGSGTVPVSGDSLIFPSGANRRTNVYNLSAGFETVGVTFSDSYTVQAGAGIPALGIGGLMSVTGSEVEVTLLCPVVLAGASEFRVAVKNTLNVAGTLNTVGKDLAFTGEGTVALQDVSGGSVATQSEGTVAILGDCQNLALTSSLGTVTGGGKLGNLITDKTLLAPGTKESAVESLTTAALTLSGNTTVELELAGSALGAFDSLECDGAALSGAELRIKLLAGHSPLIGAKYRILEVAGAASPGTFAGLPHNGQLLDMAGRFLFRISYTAGSGNDVELTCVGESSTITWTGGGVNDSRWSNPANWGGKYLQPGNTLIFPKLAVPQYSENDFPPGTFFSGLTVSDDYTIEGNGIALQSDVTVGNSTLNLLISLSGTREITVTGESAAGHFLSNTHTTLKKGAGTLRNNGTYTAAVTRVDEGVFQLLPQDHLTSVGRITMGGGRLEFGTVTAGIFNSLAAGGTVAPFFSNSQLGCANFTLNANCTLEQKVLINATNQAGGSSIVVNGAVTLGNAALVVDVESLTAPTHGQVLTILANDGLDAIGGTFAGLPQNSLISAGGLKFLLSYTGGDGNDVTLTVLSKTWTGAGADNLWSNPANWADGLAPVTGDTLLFPPGAAQLSTQNNLASSVVLAGIEFAAPYTVTGSAIQLGGNLSARASGDVVISPNVTLHAPTQIVNRASQLILNGGITTGSHPLTFVGYVSSVNRTINVTGVLSGSGPITVQRLPGSDSREPSVVLHAANTFTGVLILDGGKLRLNHPQALGSTGASTLVNRGTVEINSTTGFTFGEPLTLAGTLRVDGQNATHTWTGPVVLNTGALVSCDTATLVMTGQLSGGALRKGGPRPLRLQGTTPNIMNGIQALSGPVELNMSPGVPATAGEVAALGSGQLIWQASDQLPDTVTVRSEVNTGSIISVAVNDFHETIQRLEVSRGRLRGLTGILSVTEKIFLDSQDGALVLNLNLHCPTAGVEIEVTEGTEGVDAVFGESGGTAHKLTTAAGVVPRKTGAGKLYFYPNTIDAASLRCAAGVVEAHQVNNASGYTLDGGELISSAVAAGPLDATAAGGSFSPSFNTPFTCAALDYATGAANVVHQHPLLPPSQPGTVTRVNGSVNLGGATLALDFREGFEPVMGTSYLVMEKLSAGPVTGTFAGLPGDATFDVAGFLFRIRYNGGDGNDVVVSLASGPTGITRTWTGAGSNALWSNPQNWQGNVPPQPFDRLVFPSGAIRSLSQNDFPASTSFDQITLGGTGYTLTGNEIQPFGGIHDEAGGNTLALPLRLPRSAALRLYSPVAATLTCQGAINLNGHALTLDSDVYGTLQMQGVISGSGDVIARSNPILATQGRVILMTANTNTGEFIIRGAAVVAHPQALAPGGHTQLDGRLEFPTGDMGINESIVTVGAAVICSPGGAKTLSGTIHLSSGGDDSNLEILCTAGTVTLSGAVSGPGGLTARGSGSVTLSGSAPNTHTGGLHCDSSTLICAKSGATAVGGGSISAEGSRSGPEGGAQTILPGTITLQSAGQWPEGLRVLCQRDGLIRCNGHAPSLQQLIIANGTVEVGAGTLQVSELRSPYGFGPEAGQVVGNLHIFGGFMVIDQPLTITQTLSASIGDFEELFATGESTLRLLGTVNAPGFVSNCRTIFMGNSPTLTVRGNGAVLGIGRVGIIRQEVSGGGDPDGGEDNGPAASLLLNPGDPQGTLRTSDLDLDATVHLLIGLGAGAADKLNVTGTVSLADAGLTVVPLAGAAFTPGQSLIIIENDGTDAITGTFANQPQGSLVNTALGTFQISYMGGTGNDVTLTHQQATFARITNMDILPAGPGDLREMRFDIVGLPGLNGGQLLLQHSPDLLQWEGLLYPPFDGAGVSQFSIFFYVSGENRGFFRLALPSEEPNEFYQAGQN